MKRITDEEIQKIKNTSISEQDLFAKNCFGTALWYLIPVNHGIIIDIPEEHKEFYNGIYGEIALIKEEDGIIKFNNNFDENIPSGSIFSFSLTPH